MPNARHAIWLLGLVALTACGAPEARWASDADVSRAVYRDNGPWSLTLFTVVSNRNGSGGHTSLLVNAPSQRAIFDPAGTFKHPHLPERNDVIFGMSDAAVEFYKDYHARITWHVVEQTIPVDAVTAEAALAAIMANGAVSKAMCASSTSGILSDLPGFESAPRTLSPIRLMEWFDDLPNVRRSTLYDDSPDENGRIIQAPALLVNG